MTQLDLFESENIANLRKEVDKVAKSSEKVRRGLFARNTAIEKDLLEFEARLDILEMENYKLKKALYEMCSYSQLTEKVI